MISLFERIRLKSEGISDNHEVPCFKSVHGAAKDIREEPIL